MASNISAYDPIDNGSEATPGLWDRRFTQLQKNIVSVNDIVPDTSASVTSWAGRMFVAGNLKNAGVLSTDSRIDFTRALGLTSQISAPGALNLEANQGALTLDSSLRLDFRFGGAQTATVAAGGLTVNSGKTLVTAGNFGVLNSPVDDTWYLAVSGDTGVRVGSGITTTLSGKLMLPQENDATNPTLAFGDGDTGFYESVDGTLQVAVEGNPRWLFAGTSFEASVANPRAAIRSEQASATNPVYTFGDDEDTGLGTAGADQLSLIAGSNEAIRLSDATVRFISVRSDVADVTGLASGNTGDFSISTSHLHICVSANSWRRVALAAF